MKMILLLVLCCFRICSSIQWPVPGVTLCHRSQPDFVECLKENIPKGAHIIRQGIKEIGFPSVDPVKVPSPSIINVDNGGQMQLTLELTNCFLSGTTSSKMLDAKVDFEKDCSLYFNVDTPFLYWYGDYVMKGKLLMFQLNGHGKCNFTLINTKILQKMKCEKYQKNGSTHLKITNYTVDINPQNLIYDLQNIIPGNPEISDQVMKALNADPLLVWKEMKSAFDTIVAQMHKDVTNKFYSKMPFEEVYLP